MQMSLQGVTKRCTERLPLAVSHVMFTVYRVSYYLNEWSTHPISQVVVTYTCTVSPVLSSVYGGGMCIGVCVCLNMFISSRTPDTVCLVRK